MALSLKMELGRMSGSMALAGCRAVVPGSMRVGKCILDNVGDVLRLRPVLVLIGHVDIIWMYREMLRGRNHGFSSCFQAVELLAKGI